MEGAVNTIPAMTMCLQTMRRNHTHNMRFTWYANSPLASANADAIRQVESALEVLQSVPHMRHYEHNRNSVTLSAEPATR